MYDLALYVFIHVSYLYNVMCGWIITEGMGVCSYLKRVLETKRFE